MSFTGRRLTCDSLGSSIAPSTISFLHPAYSDGANKLLALPSLDSGGIHYGTALTFCGIIAGNSFNTGFFAKSREAEQEAAQWDSTLTSATYYYFAGSNRDYKYAIYASFEDWPLPPCLPAQWLGHSIPPSSSTRPFIGLQAQLQERDRSCRLTSQQDGCEVAHLVPRSEAVWFIRNQMTDYVNAGDPQAIDHHSNAMLLRADLHHLMDRRVWLPVLKEGRLVLCSICKPPAQPLSSQFRDRYQNVELQELAGVSKECLFARIAWAVIPLTQQFLQLRWAQLQETTALFDSEGGVSMMSSAQVRTRLDVNNQARSRTRSPTKRPRSDAGTSTAPNDNATNDGYDNTYCSWSSFSDSAYCGSSDDEKDPVEGRGRKRRRTSSEVRIVKGEANPVPKACQRHVR